MWVDLTKSEMLTRSSSRWRCSRTEQFDNAVEEYTSALNLLTSFYAPSNRALSELHMLIALALDFVPNANDRAVSHAEKAKKVLLLKLDELEQVGEQERDDKTKREIEDIKGLMGDVDMKVGIILFHATTPLRH